MKLRVIGNAVEPSRPGLLPMMLILTRVFVPSAVTLAGDDKKDACVATDEMLEEELKTAGPQGSPLSISESDPGVWWPV